MAEQKRKPNRRAHILQCLASMLENNSGKRITTAALAAEVGVSEAALYRHFPSKARMYEGLIDFVEETLFSRINKIINDEKDTAVRIQMVLHLFLGFGEKNPGIARILHGDALTGEHERLRGRVSKIFERLEETQIKQSCVNAKYVMVKRSASMRSFSFSTAQLRRWSNQCVYP